MEDDPEPEDKPQEAEPESKSEPKKVWPGRAPEDEPDRFICWP
jgi:hypothetical protein